MEAKSRQSYGHLLLYAHWAVLHSSGKGGSPGRGGSSGNGGREADCCAWRSSSAAQPRAQTAAGWVPAGTAALRRRGCRMDCSADTQAIASGTCSVLPLDTARSTVQLMSAICSSRMQHLREHAIQFAPQSYPASRIGRMVSTSTRCCHSGPELPSIARKSPQCFCSPCTFHNKRTW